jgi:hypothetical protein
MLFIITLQIILDLRCTVFQKDVDKPHSQILTKYLENRIIIFFLEFYTLFCKEVQYKIQPFRCQHLEQYISKRNYEMKVEILWMIFILWDYNCKNGPLNLLVSFQKYIHYVTFRSEDCLSRSYNPISFRGMSMKSRNLLWKYLCLKSNSYF